MAESTPTVPPIIRDGFTFTNGQFYVDVEGHLHKREDAATLYVLLSFIPPAAPVAKDGKVPRKAANTDREAHYYTAQLLHYGLPPMKTRDPAKKKLLAAFGGANGRTLEVPRAILDLEVAMSKEWRDMEAKLAKKEAVKGKKRKVEATELEDKAAESSKKAKPTATKPKTKAQIRKEIAVLPEDVARKLLTKLLADVPVVESILAAELSILALKAASASAKPAAKTAKAAALTDGAGTSSKTKGTAAKVPKVKAESKSAGNLDPSKWTGIYNIRAPSLSENWDAASGPMSLEIYPSSTSAHIWASFDFGIISGVMRSRESVPDNFKTEVPFQWRGREAGEDVMTFSEYNKGILMFPSEGKISAKMEGDICSEFTFSGEFQTRGGSAVPRKVGAQQRQAVKSWKSQWRSINARNYDFENSARWGGWRGDPEEESAFESDTTVGHHRHDSEGGQMDVDEEEGAYWY